MRFLGGRELLKNRSDENGVFVWENAPEEALGYQFYGAHVLSLPNVTNYGPKSSPHTLVFRNRIRVRGRVVDAETGEPIPSFKLYHGYHHKGNPREFWQWSLESRPRAANAEPAEFSAELADEHALIQYRVQAEGYVPRVSELLDAAILPDEPLELEFRLRKDAGYSGVLFTPDRKPAAGAKIFTRVQRNGEHHSFTISDGATVEVKDTTVTVTNEAGEFQLPHQAGPYLCFIAHEAGYAELLDVDLRSQAEITLTQWGIIEGEILIGGRPAAHVPIQAFHGSGYRQEAIPTPEFYESVRTDAAGRFRLNHCVAGAWDVRAKVDKTGTRGQDWNDARQSVELNLKPGQSFLLRLGAEGADLVGQIRLPERVAGTEVDWDQSWVDVSQQETPAEHDDEPPEPKHIPSRQHWLRPRDDGSFRVYSLFPARYDLRVWLRLKGRAQHYVYTTKLTIRAEEFVGKTFADPIDVGEIMLKPRFESR